MADKITIQLSNRRPISIDPDVWPVIASARGNDYDGPPEKRYQADDQDEVTYWRLTVREHGDGRAIVYGEVRNGEDGDWAGGVFLDISGDNHADIEGTIRQVGEWGHVPERLIRACLAALPAEEL